MTDNEYRDNHYVPVWYQKRFIVRGQRHQELYRLDLKPDAVTDSQGNTHTKNAVHRSGPKHLCVQPDLYTAKLGGIQSTAIERLFFGQIDANGRKAVDYLESFSHPSMDRSAFTDLMYFMSSQRLRTPKGLDWLSSVLSTADRNALLREMVRLKRLFGAVWMEGVWQIADASKSGTKFIFSDHPVTVYNRACPPGSEWCRGANDPDVRFAATHTVFPLSAEKALILTNLTWVRNPYQSETAMRPNPVLAREAVMGVMDIQTHRQLSQQEVREINFIIKSRAYRYVAAGAEEWLYPERHVKESDWSRFGEGYLLMPDPRAVVYSTGTMLGYSGGRTAAFDAYGRRPGQMGYSFHEEPGDEFDTLHRFQREFAAQFGPVRRGRSFFSGRLGPARDAGE